MLLEVSSSVDPTLLEVSSSVWKPRCLSFPADWWQQLCSPCSLWLTVGTMYVPQDFCG